MAVGENQRIKIISGPLKNLEGQIKKINLHKRIAIVEAEFMGNRTLLHLGIEIAENKRN
ncbi:KOW motif-containing protein [Sporofaciens musculi]|uniref:KOW motif-containing protein n=1 Tax=Sporofaciens musculi TaxID=2681861 RepID=UPI003FA6B8D7